MPQELYALINYGEMRKKLIFINEKSFLKLRELVYKGSVTIRTKGKNIKIKTPSCRALRKLNQLEEWQEEIKLPHRIDVILRPANVDAWGKVQSLSHNPRIRTQVPLQRRMSSLLQTLQHRWRSQELRLQEKIMSLEKVPVGVTSKSKAVRAHTFESDVKKPVTEPLLCFAPPPEQPIHRPVVHLSEFLSSDSICLNSYEQRIGVSIKGESLCSNNAKRVRHDSGSGEKLSGAINNKSPEQKRQKLEIDIKPLVDNNGNDTTEESDEKLTVVPNNDLLLSPNSSSRDSNEHNPVLPIIDSNLDLMDFRSNDSADYLPSKSYAWNDLIEQAAALSENEIKTDDSNDGRVTGMNNLKKEIKSDALVEITCDNGTGTTEKKFEIAKVKKVKNRKKDVRKEATHFRPLISQKVLQEIREGWTLKNAGDLTFGDLYVMFGESSKLYLEYSWVQTKETDTGDTSSDVKTEIQFDTYKVATRESISMKLKQLLMVAQLQDKTKRRGTCACGHICDHRKLNKPGNDLILSPQNNEGLFKHPNIPNRRTTQMFANVSEGMRSRLAKLYRPRTRPMFPGKQVIVQRLLPVQPGVNHSYGVVTNNETGPIPSTSKQNGAQEANHVAPNECTVTIQAIDGEISQLLTAKMNQLSETKTPAELCNTDSFKSLMELSLPDMTSAGTNKDLSDGEQEYVYPSTPLMSPMRILHETPIDDGYSVEDVSLSSILGHLESACNAEQENEQSVSSI